MSIILIRQILVNLSFLISLLFLSSLLFQSLHYDRKKDLRKRRVYLGIINGLSGIVLMYFSINFAKYLVMDFKHILLILSIMFGGIVSLVISGVILLIVTIFSIHFHGIIIILSLEILLDVLGLMMLYKIPVKTTMKWFIMGSYTVLIKILSHLFLLKDVNNPTTAILFFALGTLIAGIIVYKLSMHLFTANWTLNYLKQLASTDIITGLLNRTSFELDMKYIVDTYPYNKKIAVILIDIDYFKKINDTYGHPTGDLVLKQFGSILKNIFHGEHTIYRVGGEEFAVILLNTSLMIAIIRAEEIRKQIERFTFRTDENKELMITVSIGVSAVPESSSNLNQIMKDADNALYQAKEKGRNQIYY